MLRFTLGAIALIIMFVLGVVVWKATLDTNIYSVTFCDLVRDANHYDGRLVRVQVIYSSGVDTAILTDPACDVGDAWIRPACSGRCSEIYGMIERKRQEAGHPRMGKVRLEVVGRYYASAFDTNPNQSLRKVRMLYMKEINDARFIDEVK